MSLGHAPWCERWLLGTLLAMNACGGKVADDDASLLQQAGSSGLVGAGGTTGVYSSEPAGSHISAGGAPATGGGSGRASGGASFGGSPSAQVGGTRPVTGGSRALGGSPGTGGRASPGGANSTNVAGSFGGILASGGLRASGGKPGTGGSQALGGTRSTTSAATGGVNATGGASATGDVCVMPPDAGSCDAYFQAYYFNPFHGRCEPFIYGGCGGNANRFDSLQACEHRCTQSGCPLVVPPSSPIWTCPLSAACYYQPTTSCRCRAENGDCHTDSTCTADDAGVDASTEQSDAGESTGAPLPVVLCTCGSSTWICRIIDLLAP